MNTSCDREHKELNKQHLITAVHYQDTKQRHRYVEIPPQIQH